MHIVDSYAAHRPRVQLDLCRNLLSCVLGGLPKNRAQYLRGRTGGSPDQLVNHWSVPSQSTQTQGHSTAQALACWFGQAGDKSVSGTRSTSSLLDACPKLSNVPVGCTARASPQATPPAYGNVTNLQDIVRGQTIKGATVPQHAAALLIQSAFV